MMFRMTERITLVQARVSQTVAKQLDEDSTVLGLANRSEAVREGLKLLHRKARKTALAADYDSFYGKDNEAPLSDLAAVGDQIAAESMADDHADR